MTTKLGSKWDLDQFRARWLGRTLHGSTTASASYGQGSLDPHLTIVKVWTNDAGEWVAFADADHGGEHHRAASMEALERRLQSLAVRREG